MESRFTRDVTLRKEYSQFMEEYIQLGHMSVCHQSDVCVIPHHAIHKSTTTGTKIRVVFDASCPTSNRVCLNDLVHVGPKLHQGIADLITRFRTHQVVFTTDIKQMYRRILLRPEDRRYQHIFWRPDPSSPLQEYELNTVTYGVSSSPYLAIRTLHQLADEYKEEYPLAARALRQDTFVDDVVTGADSIEEALALQADLVDLLAQGKFELRKWSSNHPELLSLIPSEFRQLPKEFAHDTLGLGLKILGVTWAPASDLFTFTTTEIDSMKCTKRCILSAIARIFDPLGWICPVVFSAKTLIQELWKTGLGWDDPIPAHLAKCWHLLAANLSSIQEIQIPRLIKPSNVTEFHLVGFCDGSSKGYSCCAYLCAITRDGCQISLLMGKSKVAPIKPLTIKRLELCGAVLLAKVLQHLSLTLQSNLRLTSIRAFSDSSTTLAWIDTSPDKLKPFVAHIGELIPTAQWAHVDTEDNPADCCSRGVSSQVLHAHPTWWTGPSWLKAPPSKWSRGRKQVIDLPEIKEPASLCFATMRPEHPFLSLTRNVSSLTRILRITAWCQRFIRNCQSAPADAKELHPH